MSKTDLSKMERRPKYGKRIEIVRDIRLHRLYQQWRKPRDDWNAALKVAEKLERRLIKRFEKGKDVTIADLREWAHASRKAWRLMNKPDLFDVSAYNDSGFLRELAVRFTGIDPEAGRTREWHSGELPPMTAGDLGIAED